MAQHRLEWDQGAIPLDLTNGGFRSVHPVGRLARLRWLTAVMDSLLTAETVPELFQMLAEFAATFGDMAVADRLTDDGRLTRLGESARTEAGDKVHQILRHANQQWRHPGQEVVSTARTLQGVVNDSASASRFSANPHDWQQLQQLGAFCYVFVPLKAAGRIFGALGIGRFGDNAVFEAEEEALIEDLGSRAALILQNLLQTQATERIRQERDRQAGLWRIVASASRVFAEASRSVHESLQRVTRLVSERVGGVCAIRLLRADGAWEPQAEVYHADPEIKATIEQVLAQTLSLQEGISARAIASGHSVYLPRIEPDDLVQLMASSARNVAPLPMSHSLICVPLRVRGRSIGVLLSVEAGSRSYTPDDLRLCEELADLASLAIDHARLYELTQEALSEAEEDTARMAQLQRIMEMLAEAESPDDVLQTVVSEGGKALGARAGIVATLSNDGHYLECRGHFGIPLTTWEDWRLVPLSRREPLTEVVRSGEPIYLETAAEVGEHYPWMTENGTEIPGGLLTVPLLSGGRPIGALGFGFEGMHPFTEGDHSFVLALAAQTVTALERARHYLQLNEALQMRDEFLSIASHELRTPLTSMKLQVDSLLKKTQADPEGHLPTRPLLPKLQRLDRQVDRLTNLVVELLDVARVAQGRLPMELEEVDLRQVVREVADRHADELSRQECALWLQCSSAVGTWDRSRLDQVVTNLLSNALKYGAGHPITITTAVEGHEAVLTVKDQGIGIAAENHDRVFERFERVVSTRNYGGFGLGLWIVREIVQAHGGSISVDSQTGSGATFVVRLPMHPGAVS